jgi:hypothetical protein
MSGKIAVLVTEALPRFVRGRCSPSPLEAFARLADGDAIRSPVIFLAEM